MVQRILFRFTTEHLIVANTGTVFSKEGLRSILYTDKSSKTSHLKTFPDSKKQAQNHITELLQKKCNTFKDIDELASAYGTDCRTAGDYTERLLLELLQNAIDAGGEEQIGNKGIGFRSVLNGINIIEIHSGHYHVRWSDDDAKKTLERNQIDTKGKKPPLLALPAWCENKDGEIQTLLNDGYDTVIRLALTEQGINYIKEEWKQFSNDPSLLLFLNNSIELQWEHDGYPQVLWHRNQTGEIVSVEVNKEGSPIEVKYWRRFDSKGAMAAYIVDKDLRFHENTDENPLLYSFFPAALSPHPFPNLYLHHSGFHLQGNRQAVNIDEPCLNDISEVIILAASSMENEIDLLDLLRVGSSIPQVLLRTSSHDKKIKIRIWKKVKPKLAEKKFKGLGNRRLIDIKSCPKNEDMPYSMRNENRWTIWKAFLSALKATRPNGLSDLSVLQPGTENKQREETLLKFSPGSPFDKKKIQKLPWAPVESSFHPVSSSEVKIFLPSKGKIQQPPAGVEVRFLISNFLEDFRNKDDNAIPFLKEILGVHEFSAIGVIEHCVLPILETTQKYGASNELILFLKSLREADTKEAKAPIESFDWENSTRCNLARELYLNCHKKVWPIFYIYADQKWTENKFLENVYWGKRGFLDKEPPPDEKEKVSWEKFWKWLGVGWCPKVMPLLDDVVCKSGDRKGLEWDKREKIFQGTFFNENKSPDAWYEYCSTLIKKAAFIPNSEIKSLLKRTPRIKKNWTIDGGIQLLEKPESFYIIASNWPAYEKWMDTIISYSGNKQYDNDDRKTGSYRNQDFPSYLLWLIQTISWVPGDDGFFHKGRNVFLNTGPVAKEIPPKFVTALTVLQKDGRQEKHSLPEKFLEACCIRSGWKEVKDSDWKSWLKKASEMELNDDKTINNREAIRLLYRSLLDHRKLSNKMGETVIPSINVFPLWGIERSDNLNEKWNLCHQKNPPFFIDRGDLADLKLHGLKTFPVRLDGLSEKTKIHFGIKPLSEHLTGKPLNEGMLIPNFSDAAKDRINELIAYLRIDNETFSDEELEEKICSVNMRQLIGLKVQFSLNGHRLDKAVQRDEFHQKNKNEYWTTFVDESKCSSERRWEVFSEAILLACESDINKRKQVRDLLQCTDSELHSELIRAGVSPETTEDLKQKRKDVLLIDEPDPLPSPAPVEPLGGNVPPVTPDIPPTIVPPEPIIMPPGSPEPSGGNGDINPVPGNGLPTRPHPEKGLEAQHWLFKKVLKWCQDTGKPEPVSEKDKEDITIELNPPIIIEVKRIKRNAVFWSKNQIQKAHSESDIRKYVIALLRPHDTEGYEVFWVMNPIDDLKMLSSRHVQWRWKTHQGGKYDSESWGIPEPTPQKKADSYSAVIKLDEGWIDKLPKGINSSLEFISKYYRV